MLRADAYQYLCRSSVEIPEAALAHVHFEISSNLGKPVNAMFPNFAEAFPMTVNAMESFWQNPIAAFERRVSGNWLTVLLIERPDLNLFFNLSYIGNPIDGADYELSHGMLPIKWRELYRLFDSFVITAESVKPMGWINTPFPYSGRLTLEEYRQKIGAKKSKIRDFAEQIGSEDLVCWLMTEAGDGLFLDEARRDHKVYHVKGDDFENVINLPNPEAQLDHYLAHYVSGKQPAEFNFRAPH